MKKSLLPLLLVLAAATQNFATIYTWNGTSGTWSDPNNWTPTDTPGAGDDAILNGGTATLTATTTIQNLVFNDGIINGNFDMTITGTFLSGSSTTLIGTGTTSVLGFATFANGGFSGRIVNGRTLSLSGGGSIGFNGYIHLRNNAVFRNEAGSTLSGDAASISQALTNDVGSVVNHGTIQKTAGSGIFRIDYPFTNTGSIVHLQNIFQCTSTSLGGTINVSAGANFGDVTGEISNFIGTSCINNGAIGASFNASGLQFSGMATQSLSGTGTIGNLGITAASTVNLSGTQTVGAWTVISGKLGGTGNLICSNSPFNNTGTIAPGLNGIGTLGISRSNGVPISTLEMQIAAGSPATYDILNITGGINLSAASLIFTAPTSGVTNGIYPIIAWTGTRMGDFASTNLPPGYSISYDDAAKVVNLTVNVDCFSLKIVQTKISCNGGSDGAATAKPTGQAIWYTYLWSNNETTQTISGLSASTYSVVATRISTGCTHSATATIADPPLLPVSIVAKTSKCFGDDLGELRAKPLGGTGGKTYSWSNGGNTNLIENLAPDTYSVLVTDSKSCTAGATFNLTEPSEIMLSHSVSDEPDGQFTVTLSTSGGTPFTTGAAYRWCKEKPDLTCGFLMNPVFANLAAGSYTFKTRDKNNCQASSTISLPPSKPAPAAPRDADDFSIQTIENQSVGIRPNPFSNRIRLTKNVGEVLNLDDVGHLRNVGEVLNLDDVGQVKIFDTAGRTVAERDWPTNLEFLEIETSGLPAGVFFVKIFDEKNRPVSSLRAVKM